MKYLIISYLKCILQCSGIKEKWLKKIILVVVIIFLFGFSLGYWLLDMTLRLL